jgi:hypothetical protein
LREEEKERYAARSTDFRHTDGQTFLHVLHDKHHQWMRMLVILSLQEKVHAWLSEYAREKQFLARRAHSDGKKSWFKSMHRERSA